MCLCLASAAPPPMDNVLKNLNVKPTTVNVPILNRLEVRAAPSHAASS